MITRLAASGIGPHLGDVRLCNPRRDRGRPLAEVTDFEVFTGSVWLHARDYYNQLWMTQQDKAR